MPEAITHHEKLLVDRPVRWQAETLGIIQSRKHVSGPAKSELETTRTLVCNTAVHRTYGNN